MHGINPATRKGSVSILKTMRNIRIRPLNVGSSYGFDIYLDFSGKYEYLMTHRRNELLLDILKEGMHPDDLRRLVGKHGLNVLPGRKKGGHSRSYAKLSNSISHLLACIDEYLLDRAQIV